MIVEKQHKQNKPKTPACCEGDQFESARAFRQNSTVLAQAADHNPIKEYNKGTFYHVLYDEQRISCLLDSITYRRHSAQPTSLSQKPMSTFRTKKNKTTTTNNDNNNNDDNDDNNIKQKSREKKNLKPKCI